MAKEKRKDNIYLNVEFQRIARSDQKAFLSDQCKEIEENNRMQKTRDLSKKTRGTRGTFHLKMGGHNKGQKQYGPNRSRRYYKEVTKIHRRTV